MSSNPFHHNRLDYQPVLPLILEKLMHLKAVPASPENSGLSPEINSLFHRTSSQPKIDFTYSQYMDHAPLKVGVVLSGGQAAGGHNVIGGLFDALTRLNPNSKLIGFLDGPSGIIENRYKVLTKEVIDSYRNQGGFDMIGSGRTKIETAEQFDKTIQTVTTLKLDGLVVIGGDDSNTNAALLAETFLQKKVPTRVVGVPKTIDGDLKNDQIEISFGFDTATKTYSEIIGNIARDCLSAKKYYYFIKLMGRSASHIALECALQTHPNFALIGEEVEFEKSTLKGLTDQICNLICSRARLGKDYGVILIPEGIIEFIPEFRELIASLNRLNFDPDLSQKEKITRAKNSLEKSSLLCFESIPKEMQEQLLMGRDPHGNVQVSKIETERLFIKTVEEELKSRKAAGEYSGKFDAQPLFCGYEGRSGYPSNFDCHYCYALGHVAALLIDNNATGYMCAVQNLSRPPTEWKIGGIALTSLIQMEERKGKMKPVITKALVDLQGNPYMIFKEHRKHWAINDDYRYPGPIQFFGPQEVTDQICVTLELERGHMTPVI